MHYKCLKLLGLMLCQSNFNKHQTSTVSIVQLFSVKLLTLIFVHVVSDAYCCHCSKVSINNYRHSKSHPVFGHFKSVHNAAVILIFDHSVFVGALHACPALWLFIDHWS